MTKEPSGVFLGYEAKGVVANESFIPSGPLVSELADQPVPIQDRHWPPAAGKITQTHSSEHEERLHCGGK